MDDNQKKISLVEALLMVLLSLFVDCIDVVFAFLFFIPGGAGLIVILPFIDGTFFAIIEFWLIMRGGAGFRQQISIITGNILDMIPLLNSLPLKTVSTAIAIYMINHPKAMAAFSVTSVNLVAKAESVASAVSAEAAAE